MIETSKFNIRYFEDRDIDFLSGSTGVSRGQIASFIAENKGVFNDDIYFTAVAKGEETQSGFIVFHDIDYKNKHLILIIQPQEKEIIDKMARYAFDFLNMRQILLFSRRTLDGYELEGILREQKGAINVYRIKRTG